MNESKIVKVTVDVPADRYKLLTTLKEKSGKSIKSIVSEGIRLVILENKDLYGREKVLKEVEEMERTLAKLEKSKE